MQKKTLLNKDQIIAVNHKNGPLLIIAGAGAGKTRVIAHRIAKLVSSGVNPSNILAITFTNKAALEMKERIHKILNETAFAKESSPLIEDLPHISTFHSLGVFILRENSKEINRTKNFTILDRDGSLRIIKWALQELGYGDKQIDPRKILSSISKSKSDLLTLLDYSESCGDEFFPRVVAGVWKLYEDKLATTNSYDFDDLLQQAVLLLQNNKIILSYYQNKWKYIHIDEYQDTNTAQYEISRLLSLSKNNICVVGDNDQSIYSWRGADFTNILNFEKDYPGATKVILSQNYRSTKNILSLANTSIKRNINRIDKNLFTNNKDGEQISIYIGGDEKDEANFISNTIQNLVKNKMVKIDDIAILYRANFQSRVLEEALLRNNISYQVLGTRFFDRKEIKDIISFIKASENPNDIESLARIINIPPRGIGKVTLAKIVSNKIDTLPLSTREKVKKFYDILNRVREKSQDGNVSELIKFILSKSGLEKHLKNGGEDERERLENIKELVTLATKFNNMDVGVGIQSFLDNVVLMQDQDNLKNASGVKLMTVHASKGLEFSYVFICGLEEGLFPHINLSTDEIDNEEERRLFYVAVTRAKNKLYLSYSRERTLFGKKESNEPSKFLMEIDENLIQEEEEDAIIVID